MEIVSLFLALILVLYYGLVVYKIRLHAVPSFIVFNIIFDIIGFVGDSILIALLRAGSSYLFFLYYFSKRGIKVYSFTLIPLIFIIYTTLIIPLSTEIFETIRVHTRVVSYFIYMIICYDYFKNIYPNLNRLISKLPYVLLVYVIYTLLANVIDLGTLYDRSYDGQTVIRTGDIVGDFLLQISACIVLLPLFNFYNNSQLKKQIFYTLVALSILFLLVSARRSAPLIIIICYIVFFFIYRSAVVKLKYVLIIGFLTTSVLITFNEQIITAFEARGKENFTIEDIEKEKRALEFPYITYLIFSFEDPINSVFGKDLYSDEGVLPNASPNRPLHTDYARVLYGMGITGFIIYYTFLGFTFFKVYSLRKHFIKWDKYKIHYTTAMQLIIFKLAISYTGGFHVISYNSLVFGFLSAIVGYLHYLKDSNNCGN